MKKNFAGIILLLSLFKVSSQTDYSTMQILMPKMIYTGTAAELRYVFHSDADLFFGSFSGQQSVTLELSSDYPVFKKMEDKCLVQKVTIEKLGFEYTLDILFIPWKPGVIDFATFDLANLIRHSQKDYSAGAPFYVDLQPVTVNSISEKLKILSMKPSLPPRMIPGTTVLLIFLAVILLVVTGLMLYVLIKIPAIAAFLTDTKSRRVIRKLNKKTEKQLRKLLKQMPEDDREYAGSLQGIMRNYLCDRFSSQFRYSATSRLMENFERLTGGTLSEQKQEAVFLLIEIFMRTDYIRYAQGSIDTVREPKEQYGGHLTEAERQQLAGNCFTFIEKINLDEQEEENAGL